MMDPDLSENLVLTNRCQNHIWIASQLRRNMLPILGMPLRLS
jgi:hypothetical protein